MFAVTLHLGKASNNYAEYLGVILGQLFASLFAQPSVCLHSDSQLVVQQIKGLYKTKNVRLVELIKISHHLTLKFEEMSIDWLERESNELADQFSKYASQPRLLSEHDDFFRVFFDIGDVYR